LPAETPEETADHKNGGRFEDAFIRPPFFGLAYSIRGMDWAFIGFAPISKQFRRQAGRKYPQSLKGGK